MSTYTFFIKNDKTLITRIVDYERQMTTMESFIKSRNSHRLYLKCTILVKVFQLVSK